MPRALLSLLLLCSLHACHTAHATMAAAEPGTQLTALDDEHMKEPPPGLPFMRVASGDCRRCLKECLGAKIQAVQLWAMKVQAPIGLLTWYLFRNRPFRMWPLEEALAQLAGVNPAVYAGAAAAAYMSCRGHCEMDCPYPGGSRSASDLPELDNVDATDARFLAQLYQRGQRRSSGGGGSFASALSDMFRVV